MEDLAGLTPGEKDEYISQVRAEGRLLTSDEQYALFGPGPEAPKVETEPAIEVEEMEPAQLQPHQRARLEQDFFPELGDRAAPPPRLVQGVIFDLDGTLAHLARPREELMAEGARQAEAYMRAAGMGDLPDDIAENMVKARLFAEEKSEEEKEEHIADDAVSFLLQFNGYPASKMDPDVLRRAVEIFYAPEMTAWRLNPGAREALAALQQAGYRLAILANYNCDRVFQRTVDYLGIREFFDVCLCSAAVEYRKPDPAIFEIVLERWDALPYEVVVVGDSLRHDIQGGLEIGALTVQVATVTAGQVRFDSKQAAGRIVPDAVIGDLGLLPALVKEWS
jgi:HAD superfamily hydrolase (TIGR01509 family)